MNNRSHKLNLMYIDDVCMELISTIEGNGTRVTDDLYTVPVSHDVTLGEIADLLFFFKASRESLFVPDMSNAFVSKLYSTYLSFLPVDSFSYDLKMNVDDRGSFTEFLKSSNRGQVGVNISKPGITKGQHWCNSIQRYLFKGDH